MSPTIFLPGESTLLSKYLKRQTIGVYLLIIETKYSSVNPYLYSNV